ncbi:amidase [Streptomyces sp. NPDC056165]|uniref:amidase n=1 Tax=Streptomyces sp. NPDC056165 TaxID=3345733 RepID=UPI0035D8D4B0
MTTATTLTDLTATEIAAAVRAGELSPVEVAEAVIEAVDALNPTLNAFCILDHERLRAVARDLARRQAAGEELGLLAGVPLAVKDLIFVKDLPMVAGSHAFRDFQPGEDDVVVERARAADALIVGKTNTPELGFAGNGINPVFGATRNPWDTALTSGGSSAGSAVAVAARMSPLALGSDAAGSVRAPASFCGVYGLKASMGRIPLYPGCRVDTYPGLSSFESVEHIGPLSRTVQDSALLMAAVSGPHGRDRHSLPAADFDWLTATQGDIRGLRVAFSPDLGYAEVDPRVAAVVRRAVEVFELDLGCIVDEVVAPWPDPYDDFWAMLVAETDMEGMRRMVAEHPGQISPHIVGMLEAPWTVDQVTRSGMMRKRVVNGMADLMESYDLLLTPTIAVLPWPAEDHAPATPKDSSPFVLPMNLTGQPSASIPAGFTDEGLPVGLMISGRRLADDVVLRASAAFEAAAPWIGRRPAL